MPSQQDVVQWLKAVKDPEIPVLSIQDLGILQAVEMREDGCRIGIISTYSGCPAMYAIQNDIKTVLQSHGLDVFEIELLSDPIWTTDLITERGKQLMHDYGIAPPVSHENTAILCPQCGSDKTHQISQFGSTACKALYRCDACLEPFDYFKCHA